ncbi:hypothetical protein ACFSQP_02920 [Bizionia sediminis]|uniref:Uncharacterized protein n=1 Tax=Bizionia sediminis TaxID=1737064 RepID=A0ABW5KS81_9FLAO
MSQLQEIIQESKLFYPISKHFGIVINKINSYSSIPIDAKKLEKALPNVVAIAVVTDDLVVSINFDFENYFFEKMKRRLFTTLIPAVTWIQEEVTNKDR